MSIYVETVEENETKFQIPTLKSIFNNAADIACKSAVTNALKITAASTLAGVGASAFLTTGATVLAAGIGAGLYSYGKDSLKAYRESQEQQTVFQLFDKDRMKRARNALLCGVAGGAFGSWLAGTETFQTGLSFVKEYGMKGFGKFCELISSPAYASIEEHPFTSYALEPSNPVTAVQTDVATASKPNLMQRLLETVGKADHSNSPIFNAVAKVDVDHPEHMSGQFLKDRAHEVLRLKGVSWEERAALARELAEEAKAHGNRQADKFLSELNKLDKWHGKPSLAETSTSPAPLQAKASIAPLNAPAQPEFGTKENPIKVFFREAATCILGEKAADGTFDVNCTKHFDTMQGGDFIGFQQGDVKASVMLVPGSDTIATNDFMHQNAITRGVRDVLLKKIVNPI